MRKETAVSVADFTDLCGECPVWLPAEAALYWTDCTGGRFSRYRPATDAAEVLAEGVDIYGFRPAAGGGFVVTNPSGVWWWAGSGPFIPIARQADDGSPLQLNDCAADPEGRLLTASFFYDPAHKYPPGKLIRVDVDGSATVLDAGYQLANGIGFSPDARTLYVADTAARIIYAYDYDLRQGAAQRRREFVRVPATEGIPDGLAVDSEGFVWSAQWYGGCVVRYDPGGAQERRIEVPAKQPSSVAFGGPHLTDLYITTAARSEPMPVMPPGYDPATGPFGGPLYRVQLDIRGQVQFPAGLRPPRETSCLPEKNCNP